MSQIAAPLSDAAVAAFVEATGMPAVTVRAGLLAALPYITADTLRHTATQFERVFDQVGHGNDPRFVVAAMRRGADVVDPRVEDGEW